jgi:molecular chaperone DnaK
MKKAIGIDLGTTNSVVAFKDTVVKIIRNSENDELTRSCVGLNKGEMLVGRSAYLLLTKDPINTILSVKRLMGGAINDKMVQEMILSPYYKFAITSLKSGTEDAVAVVLGGKQYTPEQISSEILKKLKNDVEEKLGEVTHAVITVPAYFTEKQKNATRVAAQIAGLKVQKLLAEPTAAAISYGIDNLKAGDSKTVMIYDFGGGTFDLSILNIVDGQYMEAGTGGDRWLGGDDIDRKLQEVVLQKVSSEYNISDIRSLIENLSDRKRFQFDGQIRFQTEAAKIQLSSSKTASVMIDSLLEDENGDIIDIDVTVTREEFELIAKPFIERSIALIEQLLKEVGYDISMIDYILLVGGTSCIPLVKQMLSEKFGVGKIKVSEKPMLAIAEGAAILSHRLGDDYEAPTTGEATIEDISYSTSHDYYIELQGKNDDKIIEKQTPLPVNTLRTYRTTMNNQKIAKIEIYAIVEDGNKDRQTMGFVTIDEDLPIGSEITLDITIDIEHIFDIKAYPKNQKSKIKQIVLGRGNKDSKALDFLSNCFDKMLSNDFSEKQRDFFFKSVKKEIEKINLIGTENSDSEKWDEIGTNTFSTFEQAERITDTLDDDEMALIFAAILLNEYPDLLDSNDASTMRRLLGETKNADDSLLKIQALHKLTKITEEYPVLITLFTVKLASDKAIKTNPTDGHRLLQLHDQIVNHFRNRRKDEAFALLDEAIELRDRYDQGGTDLGSIHLGKSK